MLAGTSIIGAGLIGLSPNAFADTQYGTQLVGGLSFPGQVAFEPNGKVLVGVFRSFSMIEYDPVTNSSTSLDIGDYSNGVAVAPDGTTYYSDNDGQVMTLDRSDDSSTPLPVGGAVDNPAGLATDSGGNLFIADTGSNEILEYDPDTQVVTPIVTSGLNHPASVAVAANGDLYIADEYDGEIKKWDGAELTNVVAADEPQSVSLDADGNIFYGQLFDGSLHEYDPATSTDTVVAGGNWSRIALAPDGTLYATTQQAFYRLDEIAAPSAPQITDTTASSTSATLTFDAPTDNHGSTVTGYETSIDGGATWQHATTSGSGSLITTVGGLTRDTDYTVQLRATSAAGASDPDSVDVTTAFDVPSAPRNLVPTPGGGKIGFTVDAPSDDGGSVITGYEYSVDNGSNWAPVTVTGGAGTVTGLDNDTAYTLQLRAENSAGDGAVAAAEEVTVSPAPSGVRSLTLTPHDGAIGISFTAPKFDGDSPVDHYEYSIGGDTWLPLDVTGTGTLTGSVDGLDDGTAYTVAVRAVSDAGDGAVVKSVATPSTTPAAPTNVTAAIGDGSITLTFDAPDSNGSDITGYDVSIDGGTTFTPATVTGTGPYTATVSGLTNGQSYALVLRANNADGHGVTVTAEAATPRTTPGVMTISGAGGISHGFYLYFTAPADNGGSDVTAYQVSLDGGDTWQPLATTPGDGYLIGTVTGLDNGTSYDIQTRAVNAAGGGTPYIFGNFVPQGGATAPTITSVVPGDSALTVSFTAPTDDGGVAIDHYESSIDGGLTWQPLATTGSNVLTGTVGDLTNGTAYTLRLRAENGVIDGASATADSATPVSVPSAPLTLMPKAGNGSVTLTFTAPTYDTGLPVLRYETSADGGLTWETATVTTTGGVSSATVTGLDNGTMYSVQLRAVNAAGPGTPATAFPVTPVGPASAPTGVLAKPDNGVLDVTFNPPTDDGGSPVAYYQYSVDGGTTWHSVYDFNRAGLVSFPVSGLTNGMPYTVLVRGVNNAGFGAIATAASAVPATTPDAPTDLTLTPGDSSARLSFVSPLDDGGAAVTGYEAVVTANGDPVVVPLTITSSIPLAPPVALLAAQADTLTATLPGLTNGTRYRVQVRAVNSQGAGTLTEPNSVVPAVPTAPTLSGAATSTVAYGSTVTISGTAPAGSQVGIYFHGRGQTRYTLRRNILVGGDGTYSTTYVATDDQRYYVKVGSQSTPTVLTQVAPVVTGPTDQTVARNSTVTIHGRGVAGTTVSVRFHKAGTAPSDYSIVRRVTVAANGTFTRAFVAGADYRFYVTSDVNGMASANYLVRVK